MAPVKALIVDTSAKMKTKKATNKNNSKIVKRKVKNKNSEEDFRKIPKDKLKAALQIIKNPEDQVWLDRNRNCTTGIHQGVELESIQSNVQCFKLKQARICLMRRNWINLAKVLGVLNLSGPRANNFIYPLCVKYATLCLSHHDKELLDPFLQSVGINNLIDEVIKQCTSLPEQYKNDEKNEIK